MGLESPFDLLGLHSHRLCSQGCGPSPHTLKQMSRTCVFLDEHAQLHAWSGRMDGCLMRITNSTG